MMIYGKPAPNEVITFLKRDLMQKMWLLLLDEEFMHAYEHGVVIKCADGISR